MEAVKKSLAQGGLFKLYSKVRKRDFLSFREGDLMMLKNRRDTDLIKLRCSEATEAVTASYMVMGPLKHYFKIVDQYMGQKRISQMITENLFTKWYSLLDDMTLWWLDTSYTLLIWLLVRRYILFQKWVERIYPSTAFHVLANGNIPFWEEMLILGTTSTSENISR